MILSLDKPKFVSLLKQNDDKEDQKESDTHEQSHAHDLIAIVMFNESQCWIEFVKIFTICSNDIGVSFKYDPDKDKTFVTGIHLDKQKILDNHQLLFPDHECHCLDDFVCNIDELRILKHLGSDKQRAQSFKQKVQSFIQSVQSVKEECVGFIHRFIQTLTTDPSIHNLQGQAMQLLSLVNNINFNGPKPPSVSTINGSSSMNPFPDFKPVPTALSKSKAPPIRSNVSSAFGRSCLLPTAPSLTTAGCVEIKATSTSNHIQ